VSDTVGTQVSLTSQPMGTLPTGGTGNRAYYNGQPIMMRSSRYATAFNKVSRVVAAMPRQKFLYYATFNPNRNLYSNNRLSSWQTGIAFQIHKVDRPKANPQVKELSQYNRKRLVQTGIEYSDIGISFWDTVDDRVLAVWRDYYRWYFGDGRSKTYGWKTPVVQQNFTAANGWGFSPPDVVTWDTNFFDSLDIYVFYGHKFTQMRVYNPKITAMNWDSMESESSSLAACDMTIKHEGFEYFKVAAPITQNEITLFALDQGDYYEPSDAFGGVNAFLQDLNTGLVDTLDGILGNIGTVPFVGGVLAGLGSQALRASGITNIVPTVTQSIASSSLNLFGKFL
jgi:hypothetical protein